jgi:putative transposase
MILTYKVRHHRDFSSELAKARQVAEFAISNRDKLSSKHVKQLGLKSAIANQLLRKYGRDKRCRQISRVKLIVPGQGVRFDREAKTLAIPCLSLCVPYGFGREFEAINQVEADNRYLYVSVTVREEPLMETEDALGVDLNATGHVAVVAVPKTGQVAKLGKKAEHVHKKYSRLRRRFQKQGKLRKLKQVKRRESRIVRDLNHKVSRKIVSLARENRCRIQMEDLSGIRQRAKTVRSFRYGLNSWSFYPLRLFVEYKAKLQGQAARPSCKAKLQGQAARPSCKAFPSPSLIRATPRKSVRDADSWESEATSDSSVRTAVTLLMRIAMPPSTSRCVRKA